jgi:signal transduction histidine kinase
MLDSGTDTLRARRRRRSFSRLAAAFLVVAVVAGLDLVAGPARWAPSLLLVLLYLVAGGALVLIARLMDREARLDSRRAELHAVLQSADNGICLVDREGRLTFANVAMERLWKELHLPKDGTIWDRLAALALRTDRAEKLLAAFARLADEPALEIVEEAEVVDAGRSFVGRTVPVLDASGQLLGRVFTLRETTAERRAERLKDELVATVSHELRTPLTSAIGFLDVVLEGYSGPLGDDQREFLTIARKSANRLVRLVDDLLFTAKVEAGTLTIEPGIVRLAEVAAGCVADLRGLAERSRIGLALEDGDVDAFWGDSERLRQLLDNLVANALKFTPAGGSIVVRTGVEAGRAVIQVEDSGIGIPSKEIGLLFQRFFRASTAVERQLPGTGLGLRICKAIVDAHGGTIGVQSEEGLGTTFRVELPLRAAPVVARAKVA